MREAGFVETQPGPPFTGTIPETGIHGVPREREYDAVETAEASDVKGESARFVGLEDGSLLIEDGDGDLSPLAEAIERDVLPPYRAVAVRQSGTRWGIAAHRLRVVEVPELSGDEIELVMKGEERTLRVDGVTLFGSVRELEPLAEGRDAVVRAARLDGPLWEVRVDLL